MRRPLLRVSIGLLGIAALAACSQGEARLIKQAASSSSSVRSAVRSSARSSATIKPVSIHPAAPVPVDPARLQSLKIPILVYHHVRDAKPYPKTTWSWKMSASPSTFEAQMKWAEDHGYTAVTMDTLVGILQGRIAGPEKPFVITFDDNNLTQYTVALPVLEKHHQIAVFYIITSRIGAGGLMSADQILDLDRRGMDIESHTVTHRVLTALPVSEIDKELLDSRNTLQALLAHEVRHLAYPGTSHNKTVRERMAAMGYVTGTIMDPRAATVNDDLMKLPRIEMTDDTNLAKVLP